MQIAVKRNKNNFRIELDRRKSFYDGKSGIPIEKR